MRVLEPGCIVRMISRAAGITATIAMIATLTGCGSGLPTAPEGPPGQPRAPSEPPGSPTTEPALSRAGDLEFLLERLIDRHPDPFVDETRTAFERRVADLAAQASGLSDDAFLVEVMRLLAAGRARDGHTGLFPFAQSDAGLTAWPVALYWFEEGLYVVDALPPGEAGIGSRVVEVAGRPVEDVIEAVAPLVSGDNEWTVRARLPSFLVVPQVLRGLDRLDDDEPALTVERVGGARFALSPEPIPIAEFADWRGLFYPLVPPILPGDEDASGYLKNRHEHFWSTYFDDVLYVGYNQVQARTASGDTISELAGQVEEAFEDGKATRIIVDIRGNPGGENGTYGPFLEALRDQASRDPGSVIVLTGRSTFSAAGNFATEMRAAPGVRLIGEPTGASPNLYGDAAEVTLPASGLRVHIATRAWEFAPGDASLTVEPDVHVPVRWADYEAGVDAALDIALEDGG